MKYFFQNNRFQIILTLIGAFAGFLYWHFIGCNGSCTIKSVWYWSTLWGAVMGYLVGDVVFDFIIKRKRKGEENK